VGNPIVKLDGKYIVWSTISDSPTTYGMTRDELVAFIREEDGRRGVEELERRLERVEAKGTSAFNDDGADDTIWLNRAGPGETIMHRDEIVEFFVRRKKGPSFKALAAFREGLPKCGPSCVQIERNGCAGWCRKCWGTGFVRATQAPSATMPDGPEDANGPTSWEAEPPRRA
jgi:hypothetical protein